MPQCPLCGGDLASIEGITNQVEIAKKDVFDPVYLRHIWDRMEGSVSGAHDVAALPFGLASAFEKELAQWPFRERRPLLLWFGVFALSSKAISMEWAEFVLNEFDPNLSVNFEGWRLKFSQKFNSSRPTAPQRTCRSKTPQTLQAPPREYALYHERFGSFILQSIGQTDVERVNAAIIRCCFVSMKGPIDSFGTPIHFAMVRITTY